MEDTESILAKAIRDGGVEATIDHDNGWMTCKDRVDVYATSEPQSAFHARVAFCLDVHNEASNHSAEIIGLLLHALPKVCLSRAEAGHKYGNVIL